MLHPAALSGRSDLWMVLILAVPSSLAPTASPGKAITTQALAISSWTSSLHLEGGVGDEMSTSLRLACKREDLLELSLVPLNSLGKNSHSGPSSLCLSAEYRLGQDSMPVPGRERTYST